MTIKELLFVIIRLLGIIFISIIVGWLLIWNGIEFTHYNWEWSENNAILAFQYSFHILWGTIFCISPFLWIGVTSLSSKILLNLKSKT